MRIRSSSTIQVAPNRAISSDAYRSVVDAVSNKQRAEAAAFAREAKRTERVREAYRMAVLKFVGQRQYKQLTDHRERAARAFATSILPTKGSTLSHQDIRRLADQRREKSLAFMRGLGVDADALKALQRRYRPRPLPPPVPMLRRRARHTAQKRLRGGWTVKRPPFDGSHTSYVEYFYNRLTTDNEEWSVADPANGVVWTRSVFYNTGTPSDNDYGSSSFYSGVGFWYTMAATGMIEVRIGAQAQANGHHLHLEDAFGFSDSDVEQDNWIIMRTFTSNPDEVGESTELVSYIVANTSDDLDWHINYYPIDSIRTVHLLSNSVYAAGTQVYVEFGTKSDLKVQVDDMYVDTWMEFRWLIKKVLIRSTGSYPVG